MVLENKHRINLFGAFLQNPARVIVISFTALIAVGTLLLMLPFATRDFNGASFIDALFTATSATCVTGLIVHDTYSYFSQFGHTVIILLIQMGGLGLVTLATFFSFALRRKMRLKSLYVAQESVNSNSMFEIKQLMRLVVQITFFLELIGAIILCTVFVPKYGLYGITISIFLSISAYCNAGFDILGFEGEFTSLVNYHQNPVVLFTIMALITCGGLGFIVWQDILNYRKTKKLSLHSRIVIFTSITLIILGTIAFALFEWNNTKTIGNFSFSDKMLNSLFQSVTTRTAGFNSVDIAGMMGITKLFMVILMFIGASPGSTGGGIKTTTFIVLVATVVSVIRGKDETVIRNRKIDKSTVYKSLAVVVTAMLVVLASTATIFFTSHSGMNFKEIDALFESVSAFGTVGLSNGISAMSNTGSRIALILTMLIGRVGPVSLAISIAIKQDKKSAVLPESKIMVG